ARSLRDLPEGDPGVVPRGVRDDPQGRTRPGRLRDEAPVGDSAPDRPGLSDQPEGARTRFPPRPSPSVAALLEAACPTEDPERNLPGDPRLLPRARFRPDRFADPDASGVRGHVDPVRDRLLRPEGVPQPVGPALSRAGMHGL